jgi:molecular chaperone DnaJ
VAKRYYVILGVEPDASREDIKSAYRERVKKYHPDYYGKDREPFLEVQEAYEVLSDPTRRKAYDNELARERRSRSIPGGVTRRAPASPFRARRPEVEDLLFNWSAEGLSGAFSEIFDNLWGRFGAPTRPTPPLVENISVEIPLTRDQARRGGQVRFQVPVQAQCPACGGWGDTGLFLCRHCSGTGRVLDEIPVRLAFPGGIANHHTATLPLDRLGLDRLRLIVHFRVRE